MASELPFISSFLTTSKYTLTLTAQLTKSFETHSTTCLQFVSFSDSILILDQSPSSERKLKRGLSISTDLPLYNVCISDPSPTRQLTKGTPENGSISSVYENKIYPFGRHCDEDEKIVGGKPHVTVEVTF